jgi:hypothetical protein
MKALAMMKSGFGLAWAALCLGAVLATFIGLGFWQRILAEDTDIHISPRYSGGEVRQVIDHGSYRTLVHRMVFDGLISDRAEGFVQIDWVPTERQPLPSLIEEEFDIDGDGSDEMKVRVHTEAGRAELLHRTSWVLDAEPLITADAERILRVRLRNPLRRSRFQSLPKTVGLR